MSMSEKDPIRDIPPAFFCPAHPIVKPVILDSQIGSCVDNKSLICLEVEDSQRRDETGKARILAGPLAVRTVASNLGQSSILSRAQNENQNSGCLFLLGRGGRGVCPSGKEKGESGRAFQRGREEMPSFHLTLAPAGTSSSKKGIMALSSTTAARSIAWDSMPRMTAGFRLTMTTSFFPANSSGG